MFLFFKIALLLTAGWLVVNMADVEIDVSGTLSEADLDLTKFTNTTSTGFQKYFTIPSVRLWVDSCKQSIRPWGEFINTNNFKAPQSFSRLIKRSVNNLKYFQGNYAVISIILMAYCLLTSPLLLLTIALSLLACYFVKLRQADKKLTLGGKEISLNQQYSAVAVTSLPLYYWAGVGQAVFWVLGASFFVVSVHSGLYNIDAVLREDEQFEVLMDQI